MIDDIVERLRYWNPATFPLVTQAADEIERLRAENEALRELLRDVVEADDEGVETLDFAMTAELRDRIDAALEGK